MVTEKNVSDLVIPNIDTEKFLGELVLNYPKLVGQIVSRKPEYGFFRRRSVCYFL